MADLSLVTFRLILQNSVSSSWISHWRSLGLPIVYSYHDANWTKSVTQCLVDWSQTRKLLFSEHRPFSDDYIREDKTFTVTENTNFSIKMGQEYSDHLKYWIVCNIQSKHWIKRVQLPSIQWMNPIHRVGTKLQIRWFPYRLEICFI